MGVGVDEEERVEVGFLLKIAKAIFVRSVVVCW